LVITFSIVDTNKGEEMRILNDVKLDYKDVMLVPRYNSRGANSREQVELFPPAGSRFKNSKTFNAYRKIPIIAANMDGVGTIEMAKAMMRHNCMTALSKHIPVEELIDFFVEIDPAQVFGYSLNRLTHCIYTMGIGQKDIEKFRKFYHAIPKPLREYIQVCIDVANGYIPNFIDFVKWTRDEFKEITIYAGNVVTPEMTQALIFAGADVVKVGIGSGAVCTTRKMTGVGYPQFSAVVECAEAAHTFGAHIVADGGCVNPGDVAKAFGGGADFVMLGSMLAGHKEGGASPMGTNYFYGMSSDTAMDIHSGGVAPYRTSEGRTVEIPYKGSVDETMNEILGGLRSACTYVGVTKLAHLHENAVFVRVTQQLNTSLTGGRE
jgi:GMP reductase